MYDILDFDANFAAYCEKWMQLYQMEDDDMEETLEFIRNVVQHA